MTAGTPCPVASCISPLKPGKLMCLEHWRTTPTQLQLAVTRTWRAFVRRTDRSDTRSLMASYTAARKEAVAYHDQREARRG